MSNVGKTVLKGHALRNEGHVRWLPDGSSAFGRWVRAGQPIHAMCECGALSPAGISQSAAKRWHREHKDSLR